MLVNLWMTLQFLVVVLGHDLDAALPQSPMHLIVLVLLGAALLAPLAAWASTALMRVLSLTSRPPSSPHERTGIRHFRMPEEPGTPGSIRARAPAPVVHAIA